MNTNNNVDDSSSNNNSNTNTSTVQRCLLPSMFVLNDYWEVTKKVHVNMSMLEHSLTIAGNSKNNCTTTDIENSAGGAQLGHSSLVNYKAGIVGLLKKQRENGSNLATITSLDSCRVRCSMHVVSQQKVNKDHRTYQEKISCKIAPFTATVKLPDTQWGIFENC